MTKTLYYNYLGENGTLLTTIYLDGIYCVKKYMIDADEGKVLTKNGLNFKTQVLVPESEVNEWYEIDVPEGQN